MGVIHERMDPGQIDHIVDTLPKQVRNLSGTSRGNKAVRSCP